MPAFYKLSWIPSSMIIVGLIFASSCKDDEKPKAKISFEAEESELYENDGTIDISIMLDRAASETVVLSYTLSGTATKLTSAGGDYDITPDGGTVTIAKGETEASIEIEAFEDDEFEVDLSGEEAISNETVVVTITGIVSGPGQLGETGLVHTLNIFEDDLLVILDWDRPGGETDDVDMDLFYWADDPNDDIDGFTLLDGSAQANNSSEAIIILGGVPDWDFGFSYVYYEGTNTDLDFASFFINFGGTIDGSSVEVITEANYAAVNINTYDPETLEPMPQIVQTITKSGLDYVDLSGITVPAEGSRQTLLFGNLGNTDPSSIRSSAIRKVTLPKKYLEGLQKYRK